MTKKLLIASAILSVAATASAGGSVDVVCGDGSPLTPWTQNPYPTFRVTYSPDGDVGKPGLLWFGVLSPDQQRGAVLTMQGWETYQGGLYPPHSRYDGGLRQISFTVSLPSNALTTAEYVGYGVYLGHGVYTAEAREKVVSRRNTLNRVKPDMQAKGRWNSAFDNDDHFIWTLIQKDMTDNRKYGQYFTIPFIDCTPPQQGGGS